MKKQTVKRIPQSSMFVGMTMDEIIDWLDTICQEHMEKTGGAKPLTEGDLPWSLCYMLNFCPNCLAWFLSEHARYAAITGQELRGYLKRLFIRDGVEGLMESPYPNERGSGNFHPPRHSH